MILKDELDERSFIAIGLIMFGVSLILVRAIGFYMLFTGSRPITETFIERQYILTGISYLGQYVLGTGFFLSFMIIDERLKLNRHFKKLNIAYLITVIPNLYYFYIFTLKRFPYDVPESIRDLYVFGYQVLPAISYSLFVILFLMIFISLLKRGNGVEKEDLMIDYPIYSQ